jgi:hypothetical protein
LVVRLHKHLKMWQARRLRYFIHPLPRAPRRRAACSNIVRPWSRQSSR